jgi:protocatechuate 3,4-dioxygenase beta subunit
MDDSAGPTLPRRRALVGLGSIGLSALVASCSTGNEGGADIGSASGTAGLDANDTTVADTDPLGVEAFDRSATCTVTPEQTEGPYYFDVDSIRRDIREDRDGDLLRLGLRVRDASTCTPIPDAVVDVWHSDAAGDYSGFGDAPEDSTFLRGAQVTDADGIVEFVTVYPGWYPGRTPHIHAKVHLDRTTALTTQVYFDDDLSASVFEHDPYAARGPADTTNEDDGIFDARLLLTMDTNADGLLGIMTFDVER